MVFRIDGPEEADANKRHALQDGHEDEHVIVDIQRRIHRARGRNLEQTRHCHRLGLQLTGQQSANTMHMCA